MKLLLTVTTLVAYAYGLTNPPITGPTPPAIDCPNSLCYGHTDGNYAYDHYGIEHNNYFVQCSNGLAYCQACWPLSLTFSQSCNQCLYNKNDPCYTTQSWVADPTFPCPDLCPARGPNFSGNIKDPNEPRHYIACWLGTTVACMNCPKGIFFNEHENACLWDGKFLTRPEYERVY